MNKPMNILDLNDINNWKPIYSDFIENDVAWPMINDALSQEKDDDICKLLQDLRCEAQSVESHKILSLRNRCQHLFKTTYTHVIGYHACRVSDPESYMSKGILPSEPESLIERACQFFGDRNKVMEAVNDISTFYLDHGKETVGFFFSKASALESSCIHYLMYGSELFLNIATRLNDDAVRKLTNTGTPTLYRCAIPLPWLDNFTSFPVSESYGLTPLAELVSLMRWPEAWGGINNAGAFLLAHGLPSELIIEAIDMTSCLDEHTLH